MTRGGWSLVLIIGALLVWYVVTQQPARYPQVQADGGEAMTGEAMTGEAMTGEEYQALLVECRARGGMIMTTSGNRVLTMADCATFDELR